MIKALKSLPDKFFKGILFINEQLFRKRNVVKKAQEIGLTLSNLKKWILQSGINESD